MASGQPRVREVEDALRASPRTWLVTGAAGFIGSNLVERLLGLGQRVVGLDNFATGRWANLADLSPSEGGSFRFVEGDICDRDACDDALAGADVVLHQAALGSVPRSIADPVATHRANVDGFLTLLVAARDAGVGRFVYAASSSTYGDHPGLPKVEDQIGRALSPYAVSKHAGELYAGVFHRVYGVDTVGLRYFNVFGPRQDPEGPYAAVIPRWIGNLFTGAPCRIHGDGETSRDFCYVENVVQANLLAGTAPQAGVAGEVFNIACGEQATLNQVYAEIRGLVARHHPAAADAAPEYSDFRPGDVRHSLADIGKARRILGYEPSHPVERGLAEAVAWYAGALAEGATRGESPLARAGDQA